MSLTRNKGGWLLLMSMFVAIAFAPALYAGQTASEGDPVPSGILAFSSSRTGNADIYIINADGTGLVRITTSRAHESEPAWSPDGSRFVYESERSGRWMLFTSTQYGEEETQLTTWTSWSAAWSPDGQWIAYTTGTAIGMISSSSEDNQILAQGGRCGLPAWSPNGQSLAFYSSREGNEEIYILRLEDGVISRVTDNPAKDFAASWSPDGERLVFASERDGDLEIYTIRIDGSDLIQLTHNDVVDMLPAWSPDGEWIAFVSERDGNPEIYITSPDGAQTFRVTDSPGDNLYPAWKPIDDNE